MLLEVRIVIPAGVTRRAWEGEASGGLLLCLLHGIFT